MLLLLLSCFSHVGLCATPETAAHQAPPSLGFSRQEHWSGLPFPSSMHESEKWKWSHSVVSNSSQSRGLQPTRLLHPGDFPGKSTGVGCHCLLLCKYTLPIYRCFINVVDSLANGREFYIVMEEKLTLIAKCNYICTLEISSFFFLFYFIFKLYIIVLVFKPHYPKMEFVRDHRL